MIKLSHILREILLEDRKRKYHLSIARDEGPISNTIKEGITNSIRNRWPVYIRYMGDEENKPGNRWCEVYVWGLRKETNNNTIRIYEYRGFTLHPDKFPGWRTLRMDRIQSLAPLTNTVFNKPRPDYHPDDKHMSKIIERVNFEKEPEPLKSGEEKVDIHSPEIQKTAKIVRNNIKDDKVDFDALEKAPEFKDSKMKRALQVIKQILLKAGKGIVQGLKNLHLKEELDETN